MKLSVMQSNLNKALSTVSRIVGVRSSLPILSNVLINTEVSRLKISATNLELGISYYIGCKVEEEGSVSVPARLISDLVSNLPSDHIQLVSEKENLKLKTTNFNSTINGQNPDEFPVVPSVESNIKLKISADKLLSILSQVMISTSLDESRPVLTGVYITLKDGLLVLVATDSYRLSEIAIKSDVKLSSPIIIPLRAISEIVRILGNFQGEVELVVGKTEVMFIIGDIELVSRLIDGKFPEYSQIIPQKHTTTAIIQREAMTHAVKVASLFAKEGANTIRLEFGKNSLSILSNATQVGENTSTLTIKSQGENGEISINAKYLADVLNVITTDKVEIKINSKLDPCLIVPHKSNSKSSEQVTHIIMPLRS